MWIRDVQKSRTKCKGDYMSYPKNPDTIILKNLYYPRGLTELDVWEYYQKVKSSILKNTRLHDVMFAIMTDVNKPVLRRKGASGKTIRLTPQNYDTIITGRTIALYTTMGMYEQRGIIDIDIDPRDGFRWAKQATGAVFDYVMDKMPLVRKASIVFTGKTSFHVVCDFNSKMKIDTMRFMLQKFLRNSDLSKVYTIEAKRRPGVPNLDLSPNKIRGNYITLDSLSILGLRCMEVEYSRLSSFNPNMARIK
jgi:hypothetical protein